MGMLAKPVTILDQPGAVALAVPRGEIRFDHARFHYGRENKVIEDFSLAIAPGEKVGLVGRSGAGKSTLVNLLLRFYDLEGGRILIDGQDIATVTQESLRGQIGMVTQGHLAAPSLGPRQHPLRPPGCHRGRAGRGGEPRPRRCVHPRSRRPQGAHRLRRPRRRARREAFRRSAPTGGDRAHLPEERADPGARRGDLGAGFRGGSRDPGDALRPHGRQDGHRHRAPPLDHRGRWTGWWCSTRAASSRSAATRRLIRRGGLYAALWSRQSGGFLDLEPAAQAAE